MSAYIEWAHHNKKNQKVKQISIVFQHAWLSFIQRSLFATDNSMSHAWFIASDHSQYSDY